MKIYTLEEKLECVEFAMQHQSISQAAKELQIPNSTLHDWVKEHRNLINDNNQSHSLIKTVKKLNKEINFLKRDIDILKKFDAYFAKEYK